MNKKSITPSLRLNEDDYLKLKELKEEYDLTWTQFIACANKLLEKEIPTNGIKKDSK